MSFVMLVLRCSEKGGKEHIGDALPSTVLLPNLSRLHDIRRREYPFNEERWKATAFAVQ